MPRKPGSKQLILEFFLRNIGEVLESKDIQKASEGAVEWARRVRELRNEDGYQILVDHWNFSKRLSTGVVIDVSDRHQHLSFAHHAAPNKALQPIRDSVLLKMCSST